MSMKAQLERLLRPVARSLPDALRIPLARWWHGHSRSDTPAPQAAQSAVAAPPPPEIAQDNATVAATEDAAAPAPVPATSAAGDDYAQRVRQEVDRFALDEAVNELPRIFHYWSNTYLRPQLEAFGFSYPEDFFARQIEKHAKAMNRPLRIISIGAGNCDCEMLIARLLVERGVEDFRFECLDLTDAMLQRGKALAQESGMAGRFGFVNGDFNRWQPDGRYDVVMANQSLHHVLELEALFGAIDQAIGDDGIFITSDMIGRNGHMRWPEALSIVQEFWQELPERYRYNIQLRRQEPEFANWDCSVEGFEGIRAQDILPLALERFGFDFFLGYGNLVDPFIDRGFGPHFDPQRDWDRDFIDRLHARDDAEMLAGRIKPTHVLAVMRRDRNAVPLVRGPMTPQFCLRPPAAA